MESQPELFDRGPAAPVDLAPQASAAEPLAHRVPPGIRLGTSSWSFPGWEGLVYDRSATPGTLARHGLSAYARHPLLRAVGVDRSYYEPLPASVWRRYAEAVPDDFRFVVKATRTLVTPGEPSCLDVARARSEVVDPAATALGAKLGAVLFQFPPTPSGALGGPRAFAESLYRFLDAMPEGVPLAVEIRTPGWYTPDYRAALDHGGASHGWVVHPRMLDLAAQRALGPPSADRPTVIRWMLAPGASYEAAREAWAPFDRLQAPDPDNREAVARLALEAAALGSPAMVVINNKAEGSSPASVIALAERLGASPAS
ncbi:DUF72 domain-containing protein [Gaopeijia maritima]|uniref:DUF72 domain-containing protein n=1 Tax=Gaopeijia maritima TaxID=3119007 RepID=A0ABU9EDI2_9BACT